MPYPQDTQNFFGRWVAFWQGTTFRKGSKLDDTTLRADCCNPVRKHCVHVCSIHICRLSLSLPSWAMGVSMHHNMPTTHGRSVLFSTDELTVKACSSGPYLHTFAMLEVILEAALTQISVALETDTPAF
eukprot:3231684-Amphidinium_carterae.1